IRRANPACGNCANSAGHPPGANSRNFRNFRNRPEECFQRWRGDMDGVTLIHRARDAGLWLDVAGNALKIEPFVRLLAKHKAQVLEALTKSGLRELREL